MHRPIASLRGLGLAALALVFFATPPAAQIALPAPKNGAVLTVTGNVANKNGVTGAAFDMTMLEALPKAEIKTSTPWTRGVQVFEGVRLTALLESAGASGQTVRAVAINDYAFEFPVADGATYKVIVAYRQNGKAMSVREKGPLWIVYPLDDHKKIRNIDYHSRMVWQLKELQVR
jgi:hypothetical protein